MCSAPPELNDPEEAEKKAENSGGQQKPDQFAAAHGGPHSGSLKIVQTHSGHHRKSFSLNNGGLSALMAAAGASSGHSAAPSAKMDVINPAFVFSHFHQQEDLHIRARTLMTEINAQVALFRDLLIHMGTSRDCPEMREKIRKLRRNCVDACKHTAQLLLPNLKSSALSDVTELPSLAPPVPSSTESPHTAHLVILYFLCQLFIRELAKCSRLVTLIPMDMTGYFENRAGPSNLGNVISQILLCKQIAPDFNQEEIFSISKDTEDLTNILTESQKYLPQQDSNNEKMSALNEDLPSKWTRKRRRSSLYKNVGSFCCLCRPNYL